MNNFARIFGRITAEDYGSFFLQSSTSVISNPAVPSSLLIVEAGAGALQMYVICTEIFFPQFLSFNKCLGVSFAFRKIELREKASGFRENRSGCIHNSFGNDLKVACEVE